MAVFAGSSTQYQHGMKQISDLNATDVALTNTILTTTPSQRPANIWSGMLYDKSEPKPGDISCGDTAL